MNRVLLSVIKATVTPTKATDFTDPESNDGDSSNARFIIGLALAISSCFFIGISFVIKKLSLIRLSRSGGVRAGAGGYGYLKDWLWWTGLLTMGIGEVCNFAAYALVAASLVTPLGALSIIVSNVLACRFLNEQLGLLQKVGCFLCITGSTVIVLHAPVETDIDNTEQLFDMLLEAEFLIYVTFVMLTTFVLIAYYAPRYGNSNVLVHILICSLIGSLSVMSCKALGLSIRESLTENKPFFTSLFFFFFVSMVTSVAVQMNYLNKALDVFNTSLVTPVYYVFFTSLVLLASSILFKEWNSMTYTNILGSVCGFSTVIVAIFLLCGFSDVNVTLDSLRNHWSKQRNSYGHYSNSLNNGVGKNSRSSASSTKIAINDIEVSETSRMMNPVRKKFSKTRKSKRLSQPSRDSSSETEGDI